ncbi:MAG TPA: OmpA family protein [Bacteroidaceae bacterium]|nr:OmpA family protein [Bacteroidaceae bacterium]
MKKITVLLLSATLILSGCSSWSKTAKGGLLGGGAGAALGAGIGVLIGRSRLRRRYCRHAALGAGIGVLIGGDAQSAAVGAAIGAGVGGGAGAIIGNRMDKKAEELAAIEAAKVETITDINGLDGIKVTFDSGILFGFNSSNLNDTSKETLKKFADTMKDMEQTDITIYGHTDNVGTAQANERVSARRADAVAAYLNSCGMSKDRIITKGMSFNMPVASNDTEEGRAQNRRVEIYITANEEMVKEAAAGI